LSRGKRCFGAFAFGLALLLLGGAGGSHVAAQEPSVTVFVSSEDGQVGTLLQSELLAVLPPGYSIRAFDIELNFDAAASTFQSVTSSASAAPTTTLLGPGRLRLVSSGNVDCSGPGSCALASLLWTPLAAGDSSVTVTINHVDIGSPNGVTPAISAGSGILHLVDRVGQPAASSSTSRPDAGLSWAEAVLLIAVPLAAGLLLAVLLAACLRLVRRRTKNEPAAFAGAITSFNDEAALYLSEWEVAGTISADPDALFERMAREAARAANRNQVVRGQ
jgi:hypothetical protein